MQINSAPVVAVEKQLLGWIMCNNYNTAKKKRERVENSRGLVGVNQSTCLIISASHSCGALAVRRAELSFAEVLPPQ